MPDIYVNVGNPGLSPGNPWDYNEINAGSTSTGTLKANLLDDAGATTGIGLDQITAFGGAGGTSGVATSGAGGWPEGVFDSFWFFTSGTPKHRLTGLTNGDSYTIEIAGHQGTASARDTDVTIGGTTGRYDNSGTATPNSPVSISGTVSGTTLDIDFALVDIAGYLNGYKISITPGSALTIDTAPSTLYAVDTNTVTISGSTSTPTTGNTTVKLDGSTGVSGTVTAVTDNGDGSYDVDFTFARTTARKFDATGYTLYIDVDGENVESSAIPYLPPSGSDYVDVGTIDTGAQVYTDYTGGTFVTNDQLVWDNSPSLSFTDDLNFVVTGTLSATVYRIAADGTVDIENTMSFTLGNDGIVTAVVSPVISNVISNVVN